MVKLARPRRTARLPGHEAFAPRRWIDRYVASADAEAGRNPAPEMLSDEWPNR
jgi:hypothetical protein